jgi:protocatechuate 3,4-dioxygenase beta subunit
MIDHPNRRAVLLSAGLAASGFGLTIGQALGQGLPPTPECRDEDDPTAEQTEGPFHKPRSPRRADLREPGTAGRPLTLAGQVLTRFCKPVAGAVVDFWHADEKGDYDNIGFRYRGHLLTDAQGRYQFHTIVPALYPGRTRHYHVKIIGGGQRGLTTQLYFPNEPANRRDGLFRRELLMKLTESSDGLAAAFTFVLLTR